MNYLDQYLLQNKHNTSVGVDTADSMLGTMGTANPAPAPRSQGKEALFGALKGFGKSKQKGLRGIPEAVAELIDIPSDSRSFLASLFGGARY